MTHGIHTSDAYGELPHFKRLFRTLLAPHVDPATKIERFFAQEAAEFGLDHAFLASIDLESETERFEIVHGSHGVLKRGLTVPLSKTYCRKTIADPEGTLAVSDALAEGWGDDPAYESFGFRSYLGTTIAGTDDVCRTLCFASTTPREEPITDEEKSLVEMHSQLIEYVLTVQGTPGTWGTNVDTIEDCTVSSDDIDLMMDALRNRRRRAILVALIGYDTETSLDTVERRVNDENALLQLVHNDLPKLADTGYIKWDSDSETISKGPRFTEVEPLVQLLKEYNASYPE